MATYQWRLVPDSGSMIGLCVLADGTVVGVGNDYRLYSRPNLARWLNVPESGSRSNEVPTGGVMAATVLHDGTILGVGADHSLYTRDTLYGWWRKVPQSGDVRDVIQLRDRRLLGVGTDERLYVSPRPGDPWRQIPNSGYMLSVCQLEDGTFLAAGRNHQLYRREALEGSSWVHVSSSASIQAVLQLFDGTIVGVGTDNLLYRWSEGAFHRVPNSGAVTALAQMADASLLGIDPNGKLCVAPAVPCGWTPVEANVSLSAVTQLAGGSLLGVGTDHQLYACKGLGDIWRRISHDGVQVIAVAQLLDGTILGVGADHSLYTRHDLHSPWVKVPDSGPVIAAIQIQSGIFLGIGMDHRLCTRATLTSEWVPVAQSGDVTSIAQLPDGTILGTGRDQLVYRSRFSNLLGKIDRVVVFMLENRGLDSVLGYLYSPQDPPLHLIAPHGDARPRFQGLQFVDPNALVNRATLGRETLALPPSPSVRATNSPGSDPWEEFEHVNVQLFGSEVNPPSGTPPQMTGFLADFATKWTAPSSHERGQIEQIMHMFTPVDLPVLSTLARSYAVSDDWYSSVPTQTNANRAFSLAGTSMGLVNNGFRTTFKVEAALADDRFPTETIWNVLDRSGFHDWGVFWQVTYPPLISTLPYSRRIFPMIDEYIPDADKYFHPIDQFFQRAEAGTLPAYSFIEPYWGGAVLGVQVNGNDYHPPADTVPGEYFLKQLVQSMARNPKAWNRTLFVITFDEHGGTYDHVPPPWGAMPPWGRGGRPSFRLDHEFEFDRFGVRIPTLLVSPLVEAGTVFRSPAAGVPFDHTSVIATILDWQQIDNQTWNLGARVGSARTFDHVVTRTTPRTDVPFEPPGGAPLRYGDPWFLKHEKSGRFVVHADPGQVYYFPQLGAAGAIAHSFRLGFGPIASGAHVQIFTSQELANPTTIAWGAPSTALGAWKDQHDCYYYPTDDASNYGQQVWTIQRVGASPGDPIRYGDRVQLVSKYFPGQALSADGNYLSTATPGDTWILAPIG